MQYVAAALCTNRFVHKCMFDKPCFRQWGCSDLRDVRILHKKSFSILFFHVHLNFEASISIFENLNQVKMTPQWYWRVIYDIKRKNLKWTNFEIFHQNQDFFSFSIRLPINQSHWIAKLKKGTQFSNLHDTFHFYLWQFFFTIWRES